MSSAVWIICCLISLTKVYIVPRMTCGKMLLANLFMPFATNNVAIHPAQSHKVWSVPLVFSAYCRRSKAASLQITILLLASVVEQAGLSLTWLPNARQVFSWYGSFGLNHKERQNIKKLQNHSWFVKKKTYTWKSDLHMGTYVKRSSMVISLWWSWSCNIWLCYWGEKNIDWWGRKPGKWRFWHDKIIQRKNMLLL